MKLRSKTISSASPHPGEPFDSGADYLVVGRPIRDAADPRAAAEAIQQQIAARCCLSNKYRLQKLILCITIRP